MLEQLSNPLFLQSTAYLLHKVVAKIQRLYFKQYYDPKRPPESLPFILQKKKSQLETQFLLMHARLSMDYERERISKQIVLKDEEIFTFQIKYAEYLNLIASDKDAELKYDEKSISQPLLLSFKQKEALGLEFKKDEEIQGFFEIGLEYREGKWMFRSKLMEQFFSDVAKLSNEKKQDILTEFGEVPRYE